VDLSLRKGSMGMLLKWHGLDVPCDVGIETTLHHVRIRWRLVGRSIVGRHLMQQHRRSVSRQLDWAAGRSVRVIDAHHLAQLMRRVHRVSWLSPHLLPGLMLRHFDVVQQIRLKPSLLQQLGTRDGFLDLVWRRSDPLQDLPPFRG